MIQINEKLRLRSIEKKDYETALPWYQNKAILKYSENVTDGVYDMTVITRMYDYLKTIGTVYFIEIYEETWKPIGDVTFSNSTMPIVIEPLYWGRGIGRKVILALIHEGQKQDYKKLSLKGIYHFNERSINLFLSCGFKVVSKNEEQVVMEYRYEIN
ncbi:MAG: N-acetyltransferase [Clostridia bacterium]|nr:N-acetyltransferase [Clostridia bacterium]